MKNKRAQEEIVGFVLIMVVVAVVFLVFLGITVRNSSSSSIESVEVSQFLDSLMVTTSTCAIGFEPDFSNLAELVRDCEEGLSCINQENACEVLRTSLQEATEASWNFGEDSPRKGYIFTIDKSDETPLLSPAVTSNNLPPTACNDRVGAERALGDKRRIRLDICLD